MSLAPPRTPKDSNRKAWSQIEAGNKLWDRRSVDRRAERNRLRRDSAADHSPRELDKQHRRQVLAAAPLWNFKGRRWEASGAGADEAIGQLAEALSGTAALLRGNRHLVTVFVADAAEAAVWQRAWNVCASHDRTLRRLYTVRLTW